MPTWVGSAEHDIPPVIGTPAPAPLSASARLGLFGVAALALALRTVGTNVAFPSADHAILAVQVSTEPGWGFCLRHHYGPLLPALVKAFALAITGLGGGMTEALWRLPMALAGAAAPWLAFRLVRRMGGGATAAWAAAIWTAVLPPLVTDARYLWAYETLGATMALATFNTTYDYILSPGVRRSWAAGIVLALYLCSHLHVYAAPCVAAALIAHSARQRRRVPPLPELAGLMVPPLLVGFALFAAWRRLGGGPIGRLLSKYYTAKSAGEGSSTVLDLAQAWIGHFGWPLAASIGLTLLLFAPVALRLRGRAWPLWGWAVLFAAPMFAIGFKTGRPTQYLTQASLAAALLVAATVVDRFAQRGGTAVAWCLILIPAAWMAGGAVDANLNDGRHSHWTGVTANWGARPADPGYKAVGTYVREHVPPDAVICTLHDTAGLEAPVAAYYLGRACVASEDTSIATSVAIFRQFAPVIDVVIHERRLDAPAPWTADFERVATVTRGGEPILDVFARPALRLPHATLAVETEDARYDRACAVHCIGVPTPAPPRLPSARDIQSVVKSSSRATRR